MNTTFNFDATTTHTYFDKENKMPLSVNANWNSNGDNGKGDAIGGARMCMIAWGEEEIVVDGETMLLKDWLMEGILSCWKLEKRKTWLGRLLKGKYYQQGYRYPTYANGTEEQPVGMSRDHLTNTILAMCWMGWSEKEIWQFVKKLKFRVSDFQLCTIPLWFFMRSVSGRTIAKPLYKITALPFTRLTCWLQLKFEKFLGFGPHTELPQDEFKHMQNSDKPECIRKLNLLLYPVYAMHFTSMKIKFIKSKKFQEKYYKQFRKIVPTYNWAIQLLINDPNGPTAEMVDSYKTMKGGRWSGVTDKWWNDRELSLWDEDDPLIEYNQLDVDYLRKLYIKYGIN